jgi:hypothetical protein
MAIERIADVQVAYDAGRFWTGIMRRSGPVLAANIWADFSYAAGNPVANYYAASPLTSAKLNSIDGIDIGPAPAAGLTKYVHKVLVMPASGTNIGITEWMLNDVCLFYPFIDGDGAEQFMVPAAVLDRYDGIGCRVMVVSQGAGVGTSDVIMNYTNSEGVAGRTSTATLNFAAAPGSLASCTPAGTAYTYPCGPFLPLQAGDRGIRSIESVNVLSSAGGIAAFVIVKPIARLGGFEALVSGIAAPIEIDTLIDRGQLEKIEPGAYLGLIGRGTTAGTPAITSAEITTIWG